MDQSLTPDQELIKRILQRDESALTELYTRYSAQVHGVSFHVLRTDQLAEEATQDTFFKVWKTAYRWDIQQGKLSTWILTIARYTAIDLLRREQRQTPKVSVEIEKIYSVVGQQSPAHTTERDDRSMVKSFLHRLPAEQVQAIEMAFFGGLTHTEIADQLKEPLGTIKSRIRNGLNSIRGMWLQEN
jgi:RNA polymerase sigma-70 factor (ECF subfamily)